MYLLVFAFKFLNNCAVEKSAGKSVMTWMQKAFILWIVFLHWYAFSGTLHSLSITG
jgi:hypothetical protein